MSKSPKDIGASVRARLLQLAKMRGEDFQLLLIRYANERLLYRLAQSPYRSRFILKGAALFTTWTSEPHRTTRDIDLLGIGDSTEDAIRKVFSEVIAVDAVNDGVTYDANSLDVAPIREEQEYGGIRIIVRARVSSAKLRLQFDVGIGDAITPDAIEIEYPALLEFPPPKLLAYPPETVVAEKLEAMVRFGLVNTRMKDYYDLVTLSEMFAFEGGVLVQAIRATFIRRKTPFPAGLPVGLSQEFASDPARRQQWTAFVNRTEARDAAALDQAVAKIAKFLAHPLAVAAAGEAWLAHWPKGGPWSV
jgi:predicted nucleotidyltransferase component of viral defense system